MGLRHFIFVLLIQYGLIYFILFILFNLFFSSSGNPPKHYAQPFGWCRFSLVSGIGDNNESWHMAYHGTRPGAVRRMLDKGELLFPGEWISCVCVGVSVAENWFLFPTHYLCMLII